MYYVLGLLLGASAGVGVGIAMPVLLATIMAQVTAQNHGSPYWIFLFFTVPIGFFVGLYWGFTAGHLVAQSTDKWQTIFSAEGVFSVLPVVFIGTLSFCAISSYALISLNKTSAISRDIEKQVMEVQSLLNEKKWDAAILGLKVPHDKLHLYMQKHIPKQWPDTLEKELSGIPSIDIKQQKLWPLLISKFQINIYGASALSTFEYPEYVGEVFRKTMKNWNDRKDLDNNLLDPTESIKLNLILKNSEMLDCLKQNSAFPLEKALILYSVAKNESDKEMQKNIVKGLYQSGIKLSKTDDQLGLQVMLNHLIAE